MSNGYAAAVSDSDVIYALDVEAFADSTGNGWGDFQGLIDRLDYIDRLGASTLWLLPFYPTPNRDNGYDVTDYYGVDDRHGTLGDFVEFVEAADGRGIDVIVDLVMNHTSDQHRWFERSKDPDSKYRDFYIWKEEKPAEDPTKGSVFPGEVYPERVWSYDEEADAYYYHRFYPFQPDLNLQNPAVREELYKVLKFWLKLGVKGFRVDAATLMIQGKDPDEPDPEDPHDLLRRMKRVVRRQRGDGVLLAEADDEPEDLDRYFGEAGDEIDLMMNFVLNAHLVHALATERTEPIEEGLSRIPTPPAGSHWANFLRNYDELNIGRIPDADKAEVYERFAPEERMRIYGRGLRRRIAPMLDGDRRRIECAYSLLFSMPGTPLLLYGDEIGMGENLSLPGRESIRTPMQWSAEPNGGFSTAAPRDLFRPVIDDDRFGFRHVNVEDQWGSPDSLLEWFRRLLATRRQYGAVGSAPVEIVESGAESVLVHRYAAENPLICVHNLADEPATVPVDGDEEGVHSLFGTASVEGDRGDFRVTVGPYGYGWFRIGR